MRLTKHHMISYNYTIDSKTYDPVDNKSFYLMRNMDITQITKEEWVGIPPGAINTYHLQAGKLNAQFINGRLCHICYEGVPVIDEIYYALRDCNWGTIPFDIDEFTLEQRDLEFDLKFRGTHRSEDINYTFFAKISGSRDSTIEYSFEGTAYSSFLRNRIGFCILHPLSCAGSKCLIEHTDAQVEEGIFPIHIAPHQPFCDIKSITHFPAENLIAKAEMFGDVFEMEDQRNWTDASFKTYCTPLKEPFPVMVKQGGEVCQTIRISLKETNRKSLDAKALVSSGIQAKNTHPAFSLGCKIDAPLTENQLALVNLLHLGHLSFDYHFICKDTRGQFKEIYRQVEKLNCPMRIRVFFTDMWKDEAEQLNAELQGLNIHDISVFFDNTAVIKEDILVDICKALQPLGIPVGSGTNGYFTQINRQRLSENIVDFISYSNTPQVHAFDNDSIMSTVEGSLANIHSCRALYPNARIWISPVSMKIQWNPDATAEDFHIPGQPTNDVDQRQMSLFAAAWFIRLFSAYISSDAAGASCFCLTGSKGIMEDENPQRDFHFPAQPNMLYPLYYAFYGLRDAKKYAIEINRTNDYTIIKFFKETLCRVVIANNVSRALDIPVTDLPKACTALMIDEDTIPLLAVCANTDEIEQNFKACKLNKSIHLNRYAIVIAEFKE